QHLGHKGLGGQDGAQEVQVKDPGHRLGGQVKEAADVLGGDVAVLIVFLVGGGLGVVAAGAVDHDVAAADAGQHLGRGGLAAGCVHHVAGVGFGHAALGGDFIGVDLGLGGGAVQQGHLGPGPGQNLGHVRAEHAARAGDHGDFAGEVGIQYV